MKKEELKLVRIDSKYCDYLRKFDNRVPYNFDRKELRPFVGVLFTIDNYKYFSPLSSPRPKHLKMSSTIDFLKLDDGKLGAINFNNMIPVDDSNVIELDLEDNNASLIEKKYRGLLRKQLRWLNRYDERIYSRSKRLYKRYMNGTLSKRVADRCCDFKLLEEKCEQYNNSTVKN